MFVGEVRREFLVRIGGELDRFALKFNFDLSQTSQLLKQPKQLVVNVVRMRHDQAKVGLEFGDSADTSHLVPGIWFNGRSDQLQS